MIIIYHKSYKQIHIFDIYIKNNVNTMSDWHAQNYFNFTAVFKMGHEILLSSVEPLFTRTRTGLINGDLVITLEITETHW